MTKYIDIRSDTVTQPTAEMRRAMFEAAVGDDVYRDDPTVARLEALAAETLGKEAALLMPSGTMCNQTSIMTHSTPGDEIILGARCHVVAHEVGGAARLSGVGYALVDNADNHIYPDDVHRLARPKNDLHMPNTSLLCLENALADGTVIPVDELRATYAAGKERGLAVHLDGARIFNAAVALGVDAREIAACADSVMFCLSKGLCAPVGSLLAGDAAFIERARRNRKMLGGGMRQAGMLAAAGIVALEKMTRRLNEDHENAKFMAEGLAGVPNISLHLRDVQINMVYWTPHHKRFDEGKFVRFMLDRGVKINGRETATEFRFVTNRDVDRKDVETVVDAVREFMQGL